MARKPTVIDPWVYLGGTSRRYWNPQTGAFLSREGYEKTYGRLKRLGFASFKKATAAVPLEIRASRPARGRGGVSRLEGAKAFSGLRPLKGRVSRKVRLPFMASYVEEDEKVFYEEAEGYRDVYEDAIKRIQNNTKIFALGIGATKHTMGMNFDFVFIPLTATEAAPSFDEMLEALLLRLYDGDLVVSLFIYVRFYDKFVPKGPSRKALRIARKSKARKSKARKSMKRRK